MAIEYAIKVYWNRFGAERTIPKRPKYISKPLSREERGE